MRGRRSRSSAAGRCANGRRCRTTAPATSMPRSAMPARTSREREADMPLDKPYAGIPGTTIFDADQSRKGYWLNQFCMSLMKAENREKFKADERGYLDQWPMTEDQK